MKLWPWKKEPPPVTDVIEAQKLRAEAVQERKDAIVTGFTVSQITSYIAERRALNHFGDDIQITLTKPRRAT